MHPDTQVLWLRDLLPSTTKRGRIMSYGYDARLRGSESTLRILDYAEGLLVALMRMRKSDMVGAVREGCNEQF